MLKIKDNIDLKELEKYGFEYFINGCGSYGYSYEFKENRCGYVRNGFITIMEKDYERAECERRITSTIPLELLYDLIKDGLVIKVDD